MPFIALNRVERKRLSVFLTSLLMAVFAWLFFALSNRYKYEVNTKINFTNPPVHKAYHLLQNDTVKISVQGTGWQLLFSRLHIKASVLNISLKELKDNNYITISSQLQQLNNQIEGNQKIIRAFPDTLFFDFSERVTKKLPVKLSYQLSFKQSYGISGPVKLIPDSIMISGAAADLNKIKYCVTENLVLTELNSSVNTKIGFKTFGNNIDIIPQQVRVEIPVEEFTEKVVEVPLKLINNQGKDIRLLPENVKITVKTPLASFAAIERDSFTANVNFDGWIKHRITQLPVSFTKLPVYTQMIKVEPQVVDFIIQE